MKEKLQVVMALLAVPLAFAVSFALFALKTYLAIFVLVLLGLLR